jgi:hypothetical protein
LAFGLARLGAGLGWHRPKKKQQNIQGKQSLPPAGGFLFLDAYIKYKGGKQA